MKVNISTLNVNGVEITSAKDWVKVIMSVDELKSQNKILRKRIDAAIKYLDEMPIWICEKTSNGYSYMACDTSELKKILRGEKNE